VLANNRLAVFEQTLPALRLLDLRDNKMQVSPSVVGTPLLEVLDLSRNALR
jgi:hypothetical protein